MRGSRTALEQRSRLRHSTLLACLAASAASWLGCSALLEFKECAADADCAAAGPGLACVDGGCVLPKDPGCLPPEPPLVEGGVAIGVIQSLDPPFADSTTLTHHDAIRLAIEHANASGGLGDRPISLVTCDGGSPPDTVAAARFLVAHHRVPVILGVESSDEMNDLAAMSREFGLVLMSHWATAETISALNAREPDPTLTWRTAPSDTFQGEALADIAKEACLTRVAALSSPNDYGRGLLSGFSRAFCGEGGSGCFVHRGELPSPYDNPTAAEEYAALVAELAALEEPPEALLVLGFSDHGNLLVEAMVAAGLDFPLIVAEDLLVPDVVEMPETKGLTGPILGANPGLAKGRAFRAFGEALDARFSRDAREHPFTAHAYDSAMVIALAVAATPAGQPVTGDSIARGLARLSDTEGPKIRPADFARGARALREGGGGIDYVGTSGAVDFDPLTGDPNRTRYGPHLARDGTVCAATGIAFGCPRPPELRCRLGCSVLMDASVSGTGPSPLVLGSLLPLSGPGADVGEGRRLGVELALMQEIQADSIGRPVKWVSCDSEADVGVSTVLLEEMIDAHGVAAVIGPATSEVTLAIAGAAGDAGVLLVSPSATARDIEDVGNRPDAPSLVWRTAPSDIAQAERLSQVLVDEACAERVSFVYRDDAYGRGLRDEILGAACPTGACAFDSTAHILPDAGATEEHEALARRVVGEDVDLVLVLGFREQGIELIGALDEAGFERPLLTSETLVTVRAAQDPRLMAYGGPIVGTNPGASRGPAYPQFEAGFLAQFPEYGVPGSFAAHAYDAAYLLAFAAASLAGDEAATGDALARGLARLSGDGAERIQPKGFVRGALALKRGDDINYEGASGALDFDPATGQAPARIATFAVHDGSLLGQDEYEAAGLWPPVCKP